VTHDEIRAVLPSNIALICTLDAEARGEPLLGQIAVANVIRNRLEAGNYGRTYAQVCLAKWQFSCWWGDDMNTARCYDMAESLLNEVPGPVPDKQIQWIASGLESGAMTSDPTAGAEFYLTRELYRRDPPTWARNAQLVAEFGGHVFLKA
jgi:spore germination cell wall hydrolase CwlJ-like protein